MLWKKSATSSPITLFCQNPLCGLYLALPSLFLLLWDLLFFNRKNEVPNFMHTLILCIVYILAACVFGIFVMYEEGVDKGLLFFTGFLVEKSITG